MPPKDNARNRHRVNRVINHVRDNLCEALDLETLTDVACLSKFHFTRVFDAHLRESPKQFVARLRLEMAARKLIQCGTGNMTDIALDCGFSGSDSFSRSFKNRFACSPRTFRGFYRSGMRAHEIDNPIKKEIYKPGRTCTAHASLEFDVKTQHRPDYHVAYLRHVGPYGDLNRSITKTFTRLQNWAIKKDILTADSCYIGRCADNCSITPAERCMYDACLVLDDRLDEDDVVSVQTIPGGVFAVVDVTCRPAQLNRVWDWLIEVWLPTSGYRISRKTCYEFFTGAGRHSISSRFGIELCLPITSGM